MEIYIEQEQSFHSLQLLVLVEWRIDHKLPSFDFDMYRAGLQWATLVAMIAQLRNCDCRPCLIIYVGSGKN